MIARDKYLQDLVNFQNKHLIKVITGIRRCGKSTLLEIFRAHIIRQGVSEKQIIYVNLEDGDFRNIRTAEKLYEYVRGKLLTGCVNYVLLDEVQQAENFQAAVDWLYAKKEVDLYITGSNAYLLSGELATLLSGRYIELRMLPLSFKEYAAAFPDTKNIMQLYRDYLLKSSFPGALELNRQQDIRTYLEGIYNTILIKDIVTRRKIADPAALERVVAFMFDNIGNICSATKIVNSLVSAGRKISVPTVENYLSALVDSFVLYKAKRYDIKGKQHLAMGFKYYVADIGLRYYLLGTKQADMGHILENIVYLELLRRGYEVSVGKADDTEVDFIAVNDQGTEYYQVAQTVMDEHTLKRELKPLQGIKDHNPKYLLTLDFMPLTSYNGIKQLNALEWLLT